MKAELEKDSDIFYSTEDEYEQPSQSTNKFHGRIKITFKPSQSTQQKRNKIFISNRNVADVEDTYEQHQSNRTRRYFARRNYLKTNYLDDISEKSSSDDDTHEPKITINSRKKGISKKHRQKVAQIFYHQLKLTIVGKVRVMKIVITAIVDAKV